MFQSMLQKLHYNSVCVKLVAILSHPIMSCLDGHFGPLLYVVHVIQAGSSSVSLAFYFPLNNVWKVIGEVADNGNDFVTVL